MNRKYRYRTFNANDQQALQKTLEEYGDAGWRLVSLVQANFRFTFVMEREIDN